MTRVIGSETANLDGNESFDMMMRGKQISECERGRLAYLHTMIAASTPDTKAHTQVVKTRACWACIVIARLIFGGTVCTLLVLFTKSTYEAAVSRTGCQGRRLADPLHLSIR